MKNELVCVCVCVYIYVQFHPCIFQYIMFNKNKQEKFIKNAIHNLGQGVTLLAHFYKMNS